MKIGHEVPVNTTAGLVISSGESHDYVQSLGSPDYPLPLPVARAPLPECPNFVDLTGRRVGRLAVIGLSADKRGRWVCRCACGMYTLRTAKALKNGIAAPCTQCYKLAMAKKSDYFRRTGIHREVEDFL